MPSQLGTVLARALESGPPGPEHSRTPLGWALAVFFGIQSAQAYSIFGWLPSVFRSAGLSDIEAGYMLGIATGVGILPAFVVPVLAARLRHPSRLFLTIMFCMLYRVLRGISPFRTM